jgi:hypothetical protein
MSKLDSFSLRNNSNNSSPYIYDDLPDKLKNQIIHIWNRFMNENSIKANVKEIAWGQIHNSIAELHGEKELHPKNTFLGDNYYNIYRVTQYFDKTKEVDKLLDIIEISFEILGKIENAIKIKTPNEYTPFIYKQEDAIEDLNDRFNINRVGYEFVNGIIIKIDQKLLHDSIVTKTLNLTENIIFENSNEEFLSALNHFRFNRHMECLNDCLKAYETTLKIVCTENKWIYEEDKATVNNLIDICIENGLFSKHLISEFTSLSSLLKSGTATIRNKNSAHGSGPIKKIIPKHLASFMIYLTGSTINFIIESNSNKINKMQ